MTKDDNSEIEEIKEILIMFINRIKHSGELYPFSYKEKDRLIEIANKWLNADMKEGEYENDN